MCTCVCVCVYGLEPGDRYRTKSGYGALKLGSMTKYHLIHRPFLVAAIYSPFASYDFLK